MATPGQTLVNPASGERITFRTTSAETGGELVAIDLELPVGARVPGPLHLHPNQEERFEVIDGTMGFRVRREHVVAGPGEVVVVPPGVPHDFANDGDEPALVRVEIRPALKMEQLFETAVALAERGRTMLGGIPKPLELALFTREFEQEVQSAVAPRWLQRLALAPLAWAARLLRRDLLRARGMAARQTGLRCLRADRRFAHEAEQVGLPTGAGRRLVDPELTAVTFSVRELYDRTHGPTAGSPL